MDASRPLRVTKTDDEWKAQLTPEQYYVTRQHGTERAFSNPLAGEKRDGMFRCGCCGAPIPALAGQVFGHPSIPAS